MAPFVSKMVETRPKYDQNTSFWRRWQHPRRGVFFQKKSALFFFKKKKWHFIKNGRKTTKTTSFRARAQGPGPGPPGPRTAATAAEPIHLTHPPPPTRTGMKYLVRINPHFDKVRLKIDFRIVVDTCKTNLDLSGNTPGLWPNGVLDNQPLSPSP